MINAALDSEVVEAITNMVAHELGHFGIREVRTVAGTDHDGDPVIFVDVEYGKLGAAVDVRATARLVTKLRDALWTIGETRFPHVRHHFEADQKVVGF